MNESNAPLDEERRLKALRQYDILDTLPEEALDDLTALAATICEVPIALISLLDGQRQWFKSKVGLTAIETAQNVSFCTHALGQSELFIVADATQDARFAANPMVTSEPGIRFYAGTPLITPEGAVLGTLCVIDRVPRTLTPSQEQALRVLARQVMTHLKLRRHTRELVESEDLFSKAFWQSPDCVAITRASDNILIKVNGTVGRLLGSTPEEVIGKPLKEYFNWVSEDELLGFMQTLEQNGECLNYETTLRMNSGRLVRFMISSRTITLKGEACILSVMRDITEGRRTEKALGASELRYRRLFETAKDGILILNAETGMVVDVNPFLITTLGYSHEQFLGKAIWELDFFKDIVANESKFAELRVQEYLRYDNLPLETVDGQRIEVEFVSNVYLVSGAKVIQCNVRDVTARRKVEEVLRESERRFREMLENVELIAMTLDKRGTVTFCNDYLLRVTGWSREEAVGADWFSKFIPGSPETRQLFLDTIEEGKIPHHHENPIITRDGELRDIVWNNTMLRDETGNILGTTSIGEDVTERKRAEDHVRELAAMIDHAYEAIIVCDIQTRRITFWNRGAERLYGWAAIEAEGQDIGELIFADPSDPIAFTEQLLETGKWHGEHKQVSKAGKELTVSGHVTLVRDVADRPKSALVINIDITEQKDLEARFLRAQRMESIGTLAGGIAHDLNNSLGPIITALDLLRMRFPDADSQELLAIISSSAQRGADMVRQVLSFARGVEGRRMEVQVKHLIQEIQKIANDTFLKHIHVRTIVPYDLWTVIGDPTQLHQVLLNLCVNARDAMPNGGTLTISAENLALDAHYAGLNPEATLGSYICIQVEDTGAGIPSDVLEKIFDPFFTTKDVGKGTGLGLSTSLAIVKSHGGFIQVHSNFGKGSKFKLYLPAQTEVSPETAAEIAAEMPRGHGEVILVVDDEANVREITQQTLEAFGYRVVLAAEGAEAVSVYATRRVEIAAVLTDMTMPVMDGSVTILILRKINPSVRIIATSGMSAAGDEAHAASLGAKHFLAKPYTAETLLKALKKVLSAEG